MSFCFVLGTHPDMPRVSRLCTQGLLLAGLQEPYGVKGIKSQWTTHNTNNLPTVCPSIILRDILFSSCKKYIYKFRDQNDSKVGNVFAFALSLLELDPQHPIWSTPIPPGVNLKWPQNTKPKVRLEYNWVWSQIPNQNKYTEV